VLAPFGRTSKGDGPVEAVHPSRLAALAPQDDGSSFHSNGLT
jgi:hypothetical protein